MTIRDIAVSIGYKEDQKSRKKSLDGIGKFAKTAKNVVSKAIAVIGAIVAKQVVQMVEQYSAINAQLAYATDYLGDQVELQNAVNKAAQAGGVSYAGMAGIVKNMVQDTNSWVLSTEEALDYATQLSKVFRAAGLSRDQAANLVAQFSQSFQNGKLNNLPQMLQQAPELINYLAKSLNMSTDAVKALAQAGAISLKQFTQAIYDNLDDVEYRFQQVPLTISDAFAYLKEQFGLWLAQLNDRFKIVTNLAKTLKSIWQIMFEPIFTAVSGLFSALIEGVGGMDTVVKLFDGFNDLGKFIKGEEGTLTEESLRERGIDPVKTREEIQTILADLWETTKELFGVIKEIAGQVVGIGLDWLKSAAATIIDLIRNGAPLLKALLVIITDILKIINAILPYILMMFKVINLIAEIITAAVNMFVGFFGKIWEWVLRIKDNVVGYIDALVDKIKEYFKGVPGYVQFTTGWLKALTKLLYKVLGYEMDTSEATEETADILNGETKETSIINGGDRTITILVNNDYAFTGADRSAQKAAVDYIKRGADDIYTDLKLSLMYAG